MTIALILSDLIYGGGGVLKSPPPPPTQAQELQNRLGGLGLK